MLREAGPATRHVSGARATSPVAAVLALAFVLATVAGCSRQADRITRIGFLSSVPSAISEGFQEGLKERGLVEGRNVIIEWRWTEGKAERIAGLARELVALEPELIVTTAPQPTDAAKAATNSIPIVFIAVGDPVQQGLVPSLARPGGNLTGLTVLVSDGFTGKMLEQLKEALPGASRVAVLSNPTNPQNHQSMSVELPPAAERLGVAAVPIAVKAASELDAAFEQAARARVDALLVMGDPVIYVNRVRIAELAAKQRLPALYFFRENVEAGGLMSYGPSLRDLGRRAATYVDNILKGARPGDLAVEQPVKFDLVINLKAAKALGLAIPPTFLQRAEQVIE